MLYFLDTSALVKRYRQEAGTEIIDEIFSDKSSTVVICSLSICESVKAIDRHFQKKELSPSDFEKIIELFYSDLHTKLMTIVEIGRPTLFKANDLIMRHHLTTVDSIILASALAIEDANPVFVCADIRSGLLDAAESCRLSTLNPLSR